MRKELGFFLGGGILRCAQDDRDWRGAEGDETEAITFLFERS